MKAMYDAYEPLPILEKFPLQIETITAYDGNLVVGTKQGHLLMYSINSDSTSRMKINLLRSNKNFSRKPITQIAVVPEHQILISLSDQMISIHDLTVFNFPLLSTLQETKGAVAFDLDIKHNISLTGEAFVTVRLVVAVRRKLQFYYWKARQFHSFEKDLSLNDTPKSLLWCGEAVVVGLRYDYWLVQLTGEQKELFATGRSQQPLMTKLSDNCLAVERDEKTIFIDTDGKTVCNNLEWKEQPSALIYDEPYIIAIVSKSVQVQSQNPILHIQTIDIEKPKFLTYAVTNKNKKQVFVASATHIWSLCPVPISIQIPQLLAAKEFTFALKLADLWDECTKSKENMKQHIEKLHAFHFFCQHDFVGAMKLFYELNTDILFVIGLYPDLVPEEYRARVSYPHPVPVLPEDQLKMRQRLTKESSNQTSTLSPSVKTVPQKLQIIDTTLLKCYLKTNDSLVVPLLRMPDSRVSDEEGEKVLRQAQKYQELVLLLRIRGYHSRALEFLLRHAKKEDSPLYGHKPTVQYLQKLGPDNMKHIFEYGSWVLKSFPEDGLKIFIGDDDPSEVESLPRTRVLGFIKKTQKSLAIPYLSKAKRREVREKLQKFLKVSEHYTAATILVHFPHNDLFEERAILLGRLGQHQVALKLYIDTLLDVYLILLKLLLRTSRNTSPCSSSHGSPLVSSIAKKEDGREINYEVVIFDILKNYWQRIDLAQALKSLPDDMNIQNLKSYILRSLIHLTTMQKDNQIVRGLSQVILHQAKSELSSTQMQKILLSDKTVCCVHFI
ncbi:Vam6/Vps39-like protein, partial [Armadillidium nasatum]